MHGALAEDGDDISCRAVKTSDLNHALTSFGLCAANNDVNAINRPLMCR